MGKVSAESVKAADTVREIVKGDSIICPSGTQFIRIEPILDDADYLVGRSVVVVLSVKHPDGRANDWCACCRCEDPRLEGREVRGHTGAMWNAEDDFFHGATVRGMAWCIESQIRLGVGVTYADSQENLPAKRQHPATKGQAQEGGK